MLTSLPDALMALPHRRDVPFSRLTTLGVGGLCRWLLEPTTEAEAAACVKALHREGLPLRILGGGSNLLVLGDIETPVVRLALPKDCHREGTRLTVSASHGHIRLSDTAADLGLSGMEYASGIPGSCGGALIMNAGAHGRELVEVLASFRYLTPEGDLVEQRPEPGQFAYRWSFLRGAHLALGCTVDLVEGDREAIRATMDTARARRKGSQPLGSRNAGCIFKNPPGDSAGRLIDAAGLKGHRLGQAEVSAVHANFLLNLGSASPTEFKALMDLVRERVEAVHGIRLEPEVEMWLPENNA